MSAPSARGFWKIGVAKTLSTTSLAPQALAISATAPIGVTSSSGLAGLSTRKHLVLSRTAAFQASGSTAST